MSRARSKPAMLCILKLWPGEDPQAERTNRRGDGLGAECRVVPSSTLSVMMCLRTLALSLL